ncbi:MAG: T9SS type A sorting domain-containing protein [Bacteroidia bacterium]|nr:T9SS type A sorting domain-containing protein [Bacteroidia bacterium]MDW8417305.1 T9SS type A sorting domain-containing protein [Bacteroidia bacterium]
MRYTLVSILSGIVLAQAPSPTGGDICGYRWYTSASSVVDSAPTYSWVDPSTLNGGNPNIITGLGDDNYVGPITLPFNFVFYWNTYNRIYVGSNGYITFGRGRNVSSGGPPFFNRFPNTALPNEWIAVYLADLTFTDVNGLPVPGAKVLYGVDGQGRFVITWDSVPYWTDAVPQHWDGRNSFQLILNPNDSTILLQYKRIDSGYDATYATGNYNVVGMENITGQSGLDIAAAWPVNFQDFAIKIYHPRTFSCTVRDVQADWTLNQRGEGIFILRGGDAPQLQAGVLNTGNQTITNSVESRIRIFPSAGGTDIYRDTVVISPGAGGISPGTANTVTYDNPLNTNQNVDPQLKRSSYIARQNVRIIGASDGFSGNNQHEAEVVFCDSASGGRYILRFDDGAWDVQNEDGGGLSFPNGMTFVAPQNLIVDALSFDMFYEVNSPNNSPVVLKVYAYNPTNGSVGQMLDSVALDVSAFPNGDSLALYTNQSQTKFFYLRRYIVPLTAPINFSQGSGLAVGFHIIPPSSPTPNFGINIIVDDQTIPISRRALEGIGGIWAPYRDLEAVDYAIGLVARLASSTSVSSTDQPSFWDATIFPNPTRETPLLRVELPKAGPVAIRVVDMSGRTIWQGEHVVPAGGYKFRPPLPELPRGTYFVGVTYEGYTKGLRLVVE